MEEYLGMGKYFLILILLYGPILMVFFAGEMVVVPLDEKMERPMKMQMT